MVKASRLVAQDHTFALVDGPDFPIESADWSTGICAQMSVGAMIYAGVNKGTVEVEAIATESEPDVWSADAWREAEQWEDIAEVSLNAPVGNLEIHQLSYGPFDAPPGLPNMSPAGPGTYRIRVYSRGRDRYFDMNVDPSGEQYRIISWPASFSPPLIIRSTSRCGYSLRLGELNKIQTIPPEAPQTPSSQRKDEALRARARDGRTTN